MFRQFGSRVIVDGHRVRDDYWEAKAIKQGFTEEELSSDKRPGAAKARALAAATAVAEAAAAQAAVDQQHALLQGGHHDLSYGQYHGSASHYMQPVLPMPPVNNYYDQQCFDAYNRFHYDTEPFFDDDELAVRIFHPHTSSHSLNGHERFGACAFNITKL
ncbi:Chromatin remodelling complex subunit [Ceratocystis platani]|uniref:Chromatin remodelling complex subunit n=1 Tax=Ceratocystis fimbriata f. sp. platani TaxID=88771 RepID=A0A0F8CUT5_CERFI|nr:Chromatin remodelling complex subunit [Ceratocystis platani]